MFPYAWGERRTGCEPALVSHYHMQALGSVDKCGTEDLSPRFHGITGSYTDF